MNSMKSFKNQLIKSIMSNGTKEEGFTRDYYEEVIANWLIRKWLTDDEATECLVALDQYYPVQEESTETV